MTRQQIKETLNRIYLNLPQDFNMREVKFYVYQALQKLDYADKKERRRHETINDLKQPTAKFTKEPVSPFAKQPVTTPFKLQNSAFFKERIDIIDKMIQEEEKKIAEISAKKGKTNGPTDNIQTYLG